MKVAVKMKLDDADADILAKLICGKKLNYHERRVLLLTQVEHKPEIRQAMYRRIAARINSVLVERYPELNSVVFLNDACHRHHRRVADGIGDEMKKEEIYDEQINPLMAQVIEICRAHKIPVLANFVLGEDLCCTTALLADDYEPSAQQLEALEVLKPQSAFAIAETIESKPDGSKKITLRRIS